MVIAGLLANLRLRWNIGSRLVYGGEEGSYEGKYGKFCTENSSVEDERCDEGACGCARCIRDGGSGRRVPVRPALSEHTQS